MGHLLDFRKGQVDNGSVNGAEDAAASMTGVAELPTKLYTAGGFTAPLPAEKLVETAAETTSADLPV